MTEPAGEPEVVVPAGPGIFEAARWVGHACWSELRVHELLTDWLALEADPALATTFWAVRAHRGGLAEAWHRRLPELRELPREDLVVARPGTEGAFVALAALDAPGAGAARAEALAGALAALAEHYRTHLAVAVGPADGPTADTLRSAMARTEADLALLAAG